MEHCNIKMPAVTNVPDEVNGEPRPVCSRCMSVVATAALKCKSCSVMIHLRCSELPEYQLVRFAYTQAQYVCSSCVKTKDMDEEHYDEEVTKVRELMAKEESLIQQTDKDANEDESAQIDGAQDDSAALPLSNNENGKDNAVDPSKVCRHFVNRSCKHGPKGDGCRFDHPKLCRYYTKFGDKRGGCKKGEGCRFYHPKLCWQAARGHVCNRKNCKFLHPYGLKPKNSDLEHGANGIRPSTALTQPPSFADAAKVQNKAIHQKPSGLGGNGSDGPSEETNRPMIQNDESNFLGICRQLEIQVEAMRTMQHQLNQLMRDRMGGLGRAEQEPLGSCRHRC